MNYDFYRYKIIIEYLGATFSGWQRQLDSPSIQQKLEDSIYEFTGEKIVVYAAGRTDAGVHAIGQVAHFDLKKHIPADKIIHAINHFVRPNIAVVGCEIVDNKEFHARFSAKKRHYLYKIINRPSKIVIEAERAWWIRRELDVDIMQDESQVLIGKHDFSSFRAKNCQADSPIKTLSEITITHKNNNIELYFSAPSFLHNMVRNIVGSLVLVGLKKWKKGTIKEVLEAKKEGITGIKAPACGLYFLKVDY